MLTPSLIIIGAQKSGTSTLYELLKQVPELIPSKYKEIHYFDRNYSKGKLWYLNQFKWYKRGLHFEASPSYLFFPEVPQRILKLSKKIKFIVILRDPIDRAFSAWKMYHFKFEHLKDHPTLSYRYDNRSFEKAIKEELDALSSGRTIDKFNYISRGFYKEQIERYLLYFDKSNILFLRFEDLSNQTQVLKECKGFLNLKHDMVHTGDINIHENPTRTHSMELDSGLLYDLKKLFALKNNNLSDLIGLDLDR